MPSISPFIAIIGLASLGMAAGYAVLALLAAILWQMRRMPVNSRRLPPVTVLKPLCGAEPGLYENLRSFCQQDHPLFQIVFGVRDPADPALAVVERLQAEFPALPIDVVVNPQQHGTNSKISNLINMAARVRHDVLAMADSDVRVGPNYLSTVTAPLLDHNVGLVTCLYRGVPRTGLWSRFGALFIDDWFAPSVQVSHAFGSTRFSFGSTIALRRDALEAAGGFEALNDILADDFWLGEFTRLRGLRTVLSDVVVTTDVTDSSLAGLWAHELRWLRTIRAAEPAGFAFTFVTFTFPVLAAGLVLAHNAFCLGIAAIGAGARLVLHYLQRQWRLEPTPAYEAMLVPLRESLLLAEWAVSQTGSRVRWRNQILDATAERVTLPPLSTQTLKNSSPNPSPTSSPNSFPNPDSAS